MMFEFTTLFWYKLVFMAELIVACCLFTRNLRHRTHFALRFVAAMAVCFVSAFLFPIFFYNAWYTSLMFLALFAIATLSFKICYDEPWVNILFCAIAGYTTQHLAYEINNLLLTATGFDEGMAMGVYGYAVAPKINIFTICFYMDSYSIVYVLMYMLFSRRIGKHEDLKVNNVFFLLLSIAILLIDIILNSVVVYNSDNNYDKVNLIVAAIYNILCCVFAVSLQFGLLSNKKMHDELDVVNRLLTQEQEQYAISKENIDLINLKCHDLKHQIRLIGQNDKVSSETIREIENAINIYDSVVKTDNEALDIILTEKSLICQKNNIRLTVMADGKQLSFMRIEDIYSLFGNAIDNAIDAVMKLDDLEKRFIRFKVVAKGKILSVHIENWFESELVFRDGLPLTTKDNDFYHGYGCKSMRVICERYNGDLVMRTENNMFMVDMLFPLVQE